MSLLDLKGQTFGCLTVLNRASVAARKTNKQAHWTCFCACGAILVVAGQALRTRVHRYCRKCQGSALRSNDTALNTLYAQYRCDAKRRNKYFNLSYDEFFNKVNAACTYCGFKPPGFNGIDREDNSFGYVATNCVPCCKACNIAKRAMTKQEFLLWIRRAYEFNYV